MGAAIDIDKQTSPESPQDEADFSSSYTDNIPQILQSLNITLAFTSYQAGRLILLRSQGDTLDINYKSFPRPMGLAVNSSGITLGTFNQVLLFQREDGLLEKIKQPLQPIEQDITAPKIKPVDQDDDSKSDEEDSEFARQRAAFLQYQASLMQPVDEHVDACFIARSSHFSGMINIHDVAWGEEGLWAVNSSFSCLCTLESDYSFVPRWKPYFISELVPEDRCHLNGMALKDGKPAYVTTFSKYDKQAKWRDGVKANGTLMDVAKNQVLLDGLAMPHSPRWYRDKVYFCNSGLGELCSYDPQSGETSVITRLPGFTRGMDFYANIALVGLSKVRKSDVKNPPPISLISEESYSGIWLINLDNGEEIGHIKFTGNVDQIYDVAVIEGCCYPELIEPNNPRMRNHFCHPQLQQMD